MRSLLFSIHRRSFRLRVSTNLLQQTQTESSEVNTVDGQTNLLPSILSTIHSNMCFGRFTDMNEIHVMLRWHDFILQLQMSVGSTRCGRRNSPIWERRSLESHSPDWRCLSSLMPCGEWHWANEATRVFQGSDGQHMRVSEWARRVATASGTLSGSISFFLHATQN
jgi:hypothetical protein